MAGMPNVFRSFKSDSELRQYYLDGVVAGKTLGAGSYGTVVEVQYGQLSCTAKRMHEILVDPGNDGVKNAIEKYQRECQLMAGLQHPNITQFLGLCFLEESDLPLLVMEKLEMSVDDLLECTPNIPLPVKVSILTDILSGLVYLHGMPSPIIHRDLTARNVLLTSSLAAKITDIGNSRIVNLKPAQLAQAMSNFPNTLVYMAPEALNGSHKHGPSLDIFSFGHLALYILTQSFPGDLLSATCVDQHNPSLVVGRTEVERREVYMKKLENQFTESHPILVKLVTNCLHNYPQTRPSSEQLLEKLLTLKEEMKITCIENLVNVIDVLHIIEIKEKDKKIKKLETFETENVQLTSTIKRLEKEKQSLITAEASLAEEKALLETENKQLKMENYQLNSSNDQLSAEKLQIESLCQQEKQCLQREIDQLKRELQRTIAMSVQLEWMRGPDMPLAMTDFQSVEINGTLYVGGGVTEKSQDDYIVMAYDTRSWKWHVLHSYTLRWFAMTNINSKLVLVGGRAKDDSASGMLGEWQPDSNQWTHPFPPMHSPRWWPSATSHKHWLIVASGANHIPYSVEVLDLSNMQWSVGPFTPIPWSRMKSAKLGDTWYLMGGSYNSSGYVCDFHSASLDNLVSHSEAYSYKVWKKLCSLNCTQSCPFIFEGSLLAVGGMNNISWKSVSTIQRYVPESNTWVKAAHGLLPHAVQNCTCIMTSDKVYLIGGNDVKTIFKHIFVSKTS